jgi:hypothetical protein
MAGFEPGSSVSEADVMSTAPRRHWAILRIVVIGACSKQWVDFRRGAENGSLVLLCNASGLPDFS